VANSTITIEQPTAAGLDMEKFRSQAFAIRMNEGPIKAAAAGTPFAPTDIGNGERLAATHGKNLRWDNTRKVWLIWDSQRWAVDTKLVIQSLCKATAIAIRCEASNIPAKDEGRDDGKALFIHAVKSQSRSSLSAMEERAKSEKGICATAADFDNDKDLLNCANGTIDLRTGNLRPHNQGDMLTKLTPVEYHPDCRCPRWERFLQDATGHDAEFIAFLQVLAGYILTGHTREDICAFLYGPGGTGKSTFLQSIRVAMGDYAAEVNPDLLTKSICAGDANRPTPALATLAGVRLAAGSELEKDRKLADALVKRCTGGEAVTARNLHSGNFTFEPQFKIVLSMNHCPETSFDDTGVWRRLLRVPFQNVVPADRLDKGLRDYLKDPMGGAPAVLAWAVQGAVRWNKEGLTVPEVVKRSTEEYRQESDPLKSFCDECLIFSPDAWTAWKDIESAYSQHESAAGNRARTKDIQAKLTAKGCHAVRRGGCRGWAGVALTP
jgi:putative DNA primase/helicase